jgi:hypothetical protein
VPSQWGVSYRASPNIASGVPQYAGTGTIATYFGPALMPHASQARGCSFGDISATPSSRARLVRDQDAVVGLLGVEE